MSQLFLLFFLTVLASCSDVRGQEPQYEDYGDIFERNGGSFVLKRDLHELGWGKTECFLCHNINNIHKVERVAALKIDLKAIDDQVAKEGLNSCVDCHGNNGVATPEQ
jgi:hypothetical protein